MLESCSALCFIFSFWSSNESPIKPCFSEDTLSDAIANFFIVLWVFIMIINFVVITVQTFFFCVNFNNPVYNKVC